MGQEATRRIWTEIASKTTLTRPDEPWTARDFDRHWDGADRKLPRPVTTLEAGTVGLATVCLADAHGDPPQPLTGEGLPVWSGLLHALVGAGESCKSLLAANIAAETIHAGHAVLILDGEMSARAWRARFLELGLNETDLQAVHYAELTEQAADVAAVRAAITRLGAKLVVWDSALAVISKTARSENDNAEVARVYDRIRDICRDGPAGLIVDHVAAGAGLMISRGATAKFNCLDVAYGVKLADGNVPNLTEEWSARVTVEKDRHAVFETRHDREVTFVPRGGRRLTIDVAELNGSASHRLTVVGHVDQVARIAKLNPPATSANEAFKRLGGHRKPMLDAFREWQWQNQQIRGVPAGTTGSNLKIGNQVPVTLGTGTGNHLEPLGTTLDLDLPTASRCTHTGCTTPAILAADDQTIGRKPNWCAAHQTGESRRDRCPTCQTPTRPSSTGHPSLCLACTDAEVTP